MKLSLIVIAVIIVLLVALYLQTPKRDTFDTYTAYSVKANPGESSIISVDSGENPRRN